MKFASSPDPFTRARLLICEGFEEIALVRALRGAHNLPDFDISCIGDRDTGPGITGLRAHLCEIITDHGFSSVQHIAVLADSDDDQQRLFGEIVAQIEAANAHVDVNGRFGIPPAAFAKSAGQVPMTVIMQPGAGVTGCLETLLWRVIARVHPGIATCVDDLVACSGVGVPPKNWSQVKIDKARVRAAIAMLNKANPALALSFLWERGAPNLIPPDAFEFNDLVAHLQNL